MDVRSDTAQADTRADEVQPSSVATDETGDLASDAPRQDENSPSDAEAEDKGPSDDGADTSFGLRAGEPQAERFEALVLATAQSISSKLAVSMTIHPAILQEAISAAQSTLPSRQSPHSTLAEISHLAFWTAKLKPISINAPIRPGRIFDMLNTIMAEVIAGSGVRRAKLEAKYKVAEDQYLQYANYPISEHVALAIVLDVMEAEAHREATEVEDVEATAIWRDRMQAFKAVIYEDTFMNIVRGLRFGGNTPTTFQLLMEAVFAFQPRVQTGLA